MDTCPSPFHPRVRTVPVYSVGDTTEAEMKGYGLSALAQLATVHPSPLSVGETDPGVPGRGTKAIATVNLQIEFPELDPKKKQCLNGPRSFLSFCFSQVSNMLMSVVNARSLKSRAKRKFLQRQVKTAIRKSSNWGNFLERLE